MHPFRIVAIALALGIASVASARADGFLSPFLGYPFGGDSAACSSLTHCEDKRLSWGVSIGKGSGVVGFEEEFTYTPDFSGRTPGFDNAMFTLMSNLMLGVPKGPVRPYGIIGVGLMRPHLKLDSSSLSLSKNALGWDMGGGLNIFFSRSFGIRGDIRRLKTLQGLTLGIFSDEHVEFWRGTAGITFQF